MKKYLVYFVLLLFIFFIAIQFVPVEKSNPDITYDIPTTPGVKSILKKACYDCHSNETVWPWYGKVAPVSWLVTKDVVQGREELNYSEWDRYSNKEKIELIRESWEEVAEKEMPPWIYIKMHPGSVITPEDEAVLREWAAKTFPEGRIPEEGYESEND